MHQLRDSATKCHYLIVFNMYYCYRQQYRITAHAIANMLYCSLYNVQLIFIYLLQIPSI
jgi:hypothetical protein